MQIEMKTLQAGPGGVRRPGKIYTVSAAEGKALIDLGCAVEVKDKPKPAPKVEKAVEPPEFETATGAAASKKSAPKKPVSKAKK